MLTSKSFSARDKVLSAYAISTAQEDPQTTTTTANEEQRLSALVEQLRNENRELRKEQEAALDDRDREWEKICDDHETELSLWYEAKQKKAIENERANCQATSGADAREHAIHQECEEEKQQALAAERLLLLEQFQAQFQIEILNYKTRIDSERADTRIQAEAHNNTNPMDQVLLNEEIKKRDDSIILHQKNVTDALATNRELETTLALIKAENERLSLAVTTYESRNTLAQQTQNEAQISLMVRELSRALKLFAEISAVGLDEKHRILLNELVLANKVVTDIRTTIEDGSAIVDYDSFQGGLDRIMADSDPYDALDPRERPALHAQLTDTYTVIGGLSNILAGERGESTKWNILERIYRDNIKGKGKEGAGSGLSAASSSSSSGNGG